MHLRTYSSSKPCIIRPLFQIIGHLTFLTLNLTTCLIQKIYANIAKFKYFWRICINKVSHNKKSNILHKFLNKMSSQSWGLKSQRPIIWNGGSIYVATWPLTCSMHFPCMQRLAITSVGPLTQFQTMRRLAEYARIGARRG